MVKESTGQWAGEFKCPFCSHPVSMAFFGVPKWKNQLRLGVGIAVAGARSSSSLMARFSGADDSAQRISTTIGQLVGVNGANCRCATLGFVEA